MTQSLMQYIQYMLVIVNFPISFCNSTIFFHIKITYSHQYFFDMYKDLFMKLDVEFCGKKILKIYSTYINRDFSNEF